MQVHAGEFESFGLTERAFRDELGQGGGQGRARRLGRQPERLFRPDGVVKRKSVGPKHDFFREQRNPLLENVFELRGINVIAH